MISCLHLAARDDDDATTTTCGDAFAIPLCDMTPERDEGSNKVQTNQCTPRSSARKVAFDLTANVRTYSVSPDASASHYTGQELYGFKHGARALCLVASELPHIQHAGALLPLTSDAAGAPGDTHDAESLRGLEHWLFDGRARHRRLARRSTLQFQTFLTSRPGMTREYRRLALALASAKINAWSGAVAVETARRDALRVREGGCPIAIDARSGGNTTALPFLVEKIRQQRCPGPEQGKSDIHGANFVSKRRKLR